MKRTGAISFFLFAIFAFSGCTDKLEERIKLIKDEVTDLETQVANINSSINTLSETVSALENNVHIKSIDKISSTSYKIVFTSGDPIIIQSGTDGQSPVVGVQLDPTSGYYYWTIQYGSQSPEWMKDATGVKIKATGVTPKLKIENNWWWCSYDNGVTWSKLYESTGKEGESFFKSIDWSSDYYVKFILSNWTSFTIMTEAGMEHIKTMLNATNESISLYKRIVDGIDSNLFIKSVAEVTDKGEAVGYKITFVDGRTSTILNGVDESKKIYLKIATDSTTGIRYWMVKNEGETKFDWLYRDGDRVCATPKDGTPEIGAKDSLGIYYFTFKLSNGTEEWMRDSKGNLMRATGETTVAQFKSATVKRFAVTLVTADGEVIEFPRTSGFTPEVSWDSTSFFRYVEPASTYSVTFFLVDTLSGFEEQTSSDDYMSCKNSKLNAMISNGGYVKSITNTDFSSDSLAVNTYQYQMEFDITFKTNPTLTANDTTTLALFYSWGDDCGQKTIMKSVTFENDTP